MEIDPVTDPSYYARLGRLSAVVTILPASMAAGWIAGYYLVDHFFGTYPWGSLTVTLIGAGAGFYEIAILLSKDKKGEA
jgi:F0F1-type ATP synthase assembly protein I